MRSARWHSPGFSARMGWGSMVAVLIAGCSLHEPTYRGTLADGAELSIQWEASGTWSHLSRPVRIVAYDQATLAQVPLAQVPVDFERQMVLITGLGPIVGRDMGVRITRVWRDGPSLRVQEKRLHPGLERSAEVGRSSPWTVVVVPRCELNVQGYTSEVPKDLIRN